MQTWVVVGIAVLVLVLAALVAAMRVRTLNRPQAPAPMAPGAVTNLPEDKLTEVQALLRTGKKITAIKRLRELTPGLSLADAKNMVEAMAAGVSVREMRPRDPRPAAQAGTAAARVRALPPATEQEARRLVEQRKLVHAIKVIREGTGMGLREAKETAEAIRDEESQAPRSSWPSGDDLATRVRELRADDRTGEAIELVATETGMSLVDATRFVESVSS